MMALFMRSITNRMQKKKTKNKTIDPYHRQTTSSSSYSKGLFFFFFFFFVFISLLPFSFRKWAKDVKKNTTKYEFFNLHSMRKVWNGQLNSCWKLKWKMYDDHENVFDRLMILTKDTLLNSCRSLAALLHFKNKQKKVGASTKCWRRSRIVFQCLHAF